MKRFTIVFALLVTMMLLAIVVMSTSTVPGFAPASAPSVPRNTSRTSFGKPTMANTTSLVLGHRLRRVGELRPEVEQRLGLVPAAVVDRRGEALRHRVLAHPAAHDAGADPADARFAGGRGGNLHGVESREGVMVDRFRIACPVRESLHVPNRRRPPNLALGSCRMAPSVPAVAPSRAPIVLVARPVRVRPDRRLPPAGERVTSPASANTCERPATASSCPRSARRPASRPAPPNCEAYLNRRSRQPTRPPDRPQHGRARRPVHGLEARDGESRVLSVTTVGTPHRGTAFADWGLDDSRGFCVRCSGGPACRKRPFST